MRRCACLLFSSKKSVKKSNQLLSSSLWLHFRFQVDYLMAHQIGSEALYFYFDIPHSRLPHQRETVRSSRPTFFDRAGNAIDLVQNGPCAPSAVLGGLSTPSLHARRRALCVGGEPLLPALHVDHSSATAVLKSFPRKAETHASAWSSNFGVISAERADAVHADGLCMWSRGT